MVCILISVYNCQQQVLNSLGPLGNGENKTGPGRADHKWLPVVTFCWAESPKRSPWRVDREGCRWLPTPHHPPPSPREERGRNIAEDPSAPPGTEPKQAPGEVGLEPGLCVDSTPSWCGSCMFQYSWNSLTAHEVATLRFQSSSSLLYSFLQEHLWTIRGIVSPQFLWIWILVIEKEGTGEGTGERKSTRWRLGPWDKPQFPGLSPD